MKGVFGAFVATSGALGYIYGTLFIVWSATHAVVFLVMEDAWALAVPAAGFFPITGLVYPLYAESDASAWPFPDGTSLVPFLVVAVVWVGLNVLMAFIADQLGAL